jgi:hypothetical protein
MAITRSRQIKILSRSLYNKMKINEASKLLHTCTDEMKGIQRGIDSRSE